MKKADQPSDEVKLSIICPLTLEATATINHDPKAVNYGVTFEGSMIVDDRPVAGCWHSSQVSRGHTPAFDQALKERKELPEDDPAHIAWEDKGYYFSTEEGVEARETYEKMVLDGFCLVDGEKYTVKANGKSWKNKHAAFTGVSWEDLQAMHPDIYKTQAQKKADKPAETTESEIVGEEESSREMAREIEADLIAAEEEEIIPDTVAAVTSSDDDEDDSDEGTYEDTDDDEEEDDEKETFEEV